MRDCRGVYASSHPEVVDGAIEDADDDWTSIGRMLKDAGRTAEAAEVFLVGVLQDIRDGNWFGAAFYIRHELNRHIVNRLFEMALHESIQKNELWWQMRVLEELGWKDAKRKLLLENEAAILDSGPIMLVRELAEAKGDKELLLETVKTMANMGPSAYIIPDEDEDGDSQAELNDGHNSEDEH